MTYDIKADVFESNWRYPVIHCMQRVANNHAPPVPVIWITVRWSSPCQDGSQRSPAAHHGNFTYILRLSGTIYPRFRRLMRAAWHVLTVLSQLNCQECINPTLQGGGGLVIVLNIMRHLNDRVALHIIHSPANPHDGKIPGIKPLTYSIPATYQRAALHLRGDIFQFHDQISVIKQMCSSQFTETRIYTKLSPVVVQYS